MLNLYKNHLSIFVILLALVISIAHIAALNFYLYRTFWWFDIVMHFLGGLLVALTSLWVYITIHKEKKYSQRKTLLIAFFGIVVVGVIWEVFEYFAGISPGDGFVIDTTMDSVMNLLGAGVGLLYFNHTYNVEKPSYKSR